MLRFKRKNISMIVCDMAGTIINERGIIYNIMESTLNDIGIYVTKEEKQNWGGRYKYSVFSHEIAKHTSDYNKQNLLLQKVENIFPEKLNNMYFNEPNNIRLIHEELFDLFDVLRINGIKIALNTGYPKEIQEKLIKKFNLHLHVDDYISSEDVKYGRPYPYMIHKLMERNYIINGNNVIKIGDTINDIKEGQNASCNLSIGVLSGSTSITQFKSAGADLLYDSIMDIDIDILKENVFLL